MTALLPWSTCNNTWNTANCSEDLYSAASQVGNWSNPTADLNSSVGRTSPSEEYYTYEVLGRSAGLGEMGTLRWHLSLCLLLTWIVTFLCIIRGIKSAGKVAYVMSTFPYIIMSVLMIRAFTLDGYLEGIQFYVTPDWSRLGEGAVWYDAAVQALFSLGTGYGGLIMLASYNHFHNNCARDALLLSFGDFATSGFAGFVIFAILGVMAKNFNTTVDKVIKSEVGLAFIAFPDAVTRLPISPLWSLLFFLMLFLLGLDSQMVSVEVLAVCLVEEWPSLFKRKIWVSLVLCGIMYLVGLPMVTNGGSYILILLDSYATSWPLLACAFLGPITIAWIYGIGRFSKDIKSMVNAELSLWWKVMYCGVIPVIVVFVLIFRAVQFESPRYDSYAYPWWGHLIGWLITASTLLPIPLNAAYAIFTSEGSTLRERLKQTLKAPPDFGPALAKNRIYAAYFQPELVRRASTSTTASDATTFLTASPYPLRHRSSRDLLADEIIGTSPKRVADLKKSLQTNLLQAFSVYGDVDELVVQKRPLKPPPGRDVATQTMLPPIGEEEEQSVVLHSPPPEYNDMSFSSNDSSLDKTNQTNFEENGNLSIEECSDIPDRESLQAGSPDMVDSPVIELGDQCASPELLRRSAIIQSTPERKPAGDTVKREDSDLNGNRTDRYSLAPVLMQDDVTCQAELRPINGHADVNLLNDEFQQTRL